MTFQVLYISITFSSNPTSPHQKTNWYQSLTELYGILKNHLTLEFQIFTKEVKTVLETFS